MSDPTNLIIDAFLDLPMGEALLLHRVIGRVLERVGDGGIAAATVVRPRKLAGIHVARPVPETDPAAEAASTTSPAPRRRRRRTTAGPTVPVPVEEAKWGAEMAELLTHDDKDDPPAEG
jgi:hypothetical protein